jgi:hypothetical protein
MIYALKFLRGLEPSFEKSRYDVAAIAPYEAQIKEILTRRQLDACDDWRKLGEQLSGESIEDFDLDKYQQEYLNAPEGSKDSTFLGKFFLAALAQKSMVTNRIFKSGNRLAGFSVDYDEKGLRGMRDYYRLAKAARRDEE